jgi:hypothetical protein
MTTNPLNPLLGKVKLPGKVFQLPSKGLFYQTGVLAESVHNGEIQVKPMSALVELKIRSADLLISTKIIREVCTECAPEILKPEMLLSKDVDALFLFLVTSTYGNLKVIRSMHDCEKGEVHDYSVDLEPIISNPRNDSLEHRDVLYTLDLDNGQIIRLKPVIFIDAVDMLLLRQAVSKKELDNPATVTNKEMEEIVIRDIIAVIESVSTGEPDSVTVTDRKMITEWIRALSKRHIDLIIEAANRSADWGFNMVTKLTCKNCGAIYDHNIELNPINFFSG